MKIVFATLAIMGIAAALFAVALPGILIGGTLLLFVVGALAFIVGIVGLWKGVVIKFR